ncbi:NAD(P)/FAD-dependent oxidoreductase [bacterium]|nr:MAG: NAD(P)/FAD-dependent oxidoreductase [bacterium]
MIPESTQKKKLVVIGNGMAGGRLAAELVARGATKHYDISIFGDEPGGSYNRILLSDVLNGSKMPESIVIHPLEWYEANHLTLHAGERVIAVDRMNRLVQGDRGTTLHYDTLVFATGSRAFIPPMEGLSAPWGERKSGVFVMRTLRDCAGIAGYAQKAQRAIVVGGGLLGLEAARGLMEHGAAVHLVHRSNCLMSAQLDQVSGKFLKDTVEKMGITVHLDKDTKAILGEESATGLAFSDGTELPCDMVVVACGIAANIELAREAGLAIEKAIVVDDQMQVEENIYAVGECAQHRGEVYGLVAPIWEQARVLADVLTGRTAAYSGSKLAVKLKVMGVELASMGRTREREGDEIVCYQEAQRGRYKKLVIRDGRLAGAILLGDVRKTATLAQFFDRQMPLPEERASLFFDIGKGAGNTTKALPDDATVCNCNGVSAGKIRACIKEGANEISLVMASTKAGTGCGSCKSQLREFLG